MGKTTALRRELKKTWVPLLESKGFTVNSSDAPMFMRFRRTGGNAVHLLEIQWDKYGRRRFAINFGKCPLDGIHVGGERIPADKVYVTWLEEHGRLQFRGTRGWRVRDWFSQEKSLIERFAGGGKVRTPEEMVKYLVSLLPELEAYWSRGEVGPHLRIIRIPRQ